MAKVETIGVPRPVRVSFPVQVSFDGETFRISEFTANLSVGGVFLPTDRIVEPRTRGTLTFRVSAWERPFTVEAEVVRTAPQGGGPSDQPHGLGIMFVDLTPRDRRRLERLVDGIRDGSVTRAIRRSIREEDENALKELRRRPTDHKVILAIQAQSEEIDALIRDGNPTVVMRLLGNPRTSHGHVRTILRDPRMPTKVLLAIKRTSRWLGDEESRALFCMHPQAPLQDAIAALERLPAARLAVVERNSNVRAQMRDRARALLGGRAGSSR